MSHVSHSIFGHHAVLSALNSPVIVIREIYYLQDPHSSKLQKLLAEAKAKNIFMKPSDRGQLDKLASGGNHQGIIAMAERTRSWEEGDLLGILQEAQDSQTARILVLDGVQDPHNLGACLRSADAFGIKAVIIPKDKSCPITPIVEKVACGAAQTVPVIPVTNLARAMKELKDHDFWLVGFAGEADQTLDQVDTSGNLALVMGGEGEGLRRLTKEHCDFLVKIPMIGTVESLNVSVATGIALYTTRAIK